MDCPIVSEESCVDGIALGPRSVPRDLADSLEAAARVGAPVFLADIEDEVAVLARDPSRWVGDITVRLEVGAGKFSISSHRSTGPLTASAAHARPSPIFRDST